MTRQICRMLKDAGCHSVDFGLECGDENLRARVLGKGVLNEHIYSAATFLREAKIKFRTTNMFGLPGESLDQAFSTIVLNQKIRTNFPSASVYQPYPRTELGDQVIEQGLAGKHYDVNTIGTSFFRSSVLDIQHRNEYVNLQKLSWPAVRFPVLMPLIKKLIRVKPNPVFELIFLFFYALNYMLSEKLTLKHVVRVGWRTARSVFFGK